jgi:TfoX/Sxy family transcriptional regulator of competence genes
MEKNLIALRIADQLLLRGVSFEQKKMFGGFCFLVDDKMLLGANHQHKLMVRIDPIEETSLLEKHPAAQVMIHGNRPMPGFLFIEPEGFEHDSELEFWIDKCLEFNPRAKSSKKK